MKNKLFIIDASSILVTNFFATSKNAFNKTSPETELMNVQTNSEIEEFFNIYNIDGKIYTNGVYGMLKIILKILKHQNPVYVCFCFDETRNTFRRELFPDYKGTRPETASELAQQFPLMKSILSKIGFKIYSGFEYEADDYAGTVANKFKNDADIILITKDHDYLQLVDKNIKVWMPVSEKKLNDNLDKIGMSKTDYYSLRLPFNYFEYNEKAVKLVEGVSPMNIIDFKALVGDTADNIPGVKGIGLSIVPLINKYGSVENIYKALEENKNIEELWKKESLIKRKISKCLLAESDTELVGKKAALLSKQLATIKTDIPIDDKITDLKCSFNTTNLNKICELLQFKTI